MYNINSILKTANLALVTLFIWFVLSIIASYPLANYFSLATQVALHIGTIVIAGLFKLSYVVRCVCQYHLGMEVR